MIQRRKRDCQDIPLDTISSSIITCFAKNCFYRSESCNIQRPCNFPKNFIYIFGMILTINSTTSAQLTDVSL